MELPKVVAQVIAALFVAWVGAQLGFWGDLRSGNYRYRVEAATALARDAVEIPQVIQALFDSHIQTYHYRAAWQKFNDQKARDISEFWNERSGELGLELGRVKGRLHETISRVRILFPKTPDIQSTLSALDKAAAEIPINRYGFC